MLTIGVYFFGLRISIMDSNIFIKFKSFFSVIFSVYIGLICLVIFLENKNPSKTLAWLLVLSLLPGLGFILYIMFGANYRRKWKSNRKKIEDINRFVLKKKQLEIFNSLDAMSDHNQMDDELISTKKLLRLLINNTDSTFTMNNSAEVLTNGIATFQSIIEALGEAKETIHLEYFIIRNDDIGNKIKDILIKKAKSGVKVRLIFDSVGCWKIGVDYINALKQAGVEVTEFFPVFFPLFSRELNYRNHRKIIVIDGKIGFVGGLNIGDEYLGKKELGFWRDTHLKIKGEAVHELQRIFIRDWEYSKKTVLDTNGLFPKPHIDGDKVIQIASSGPDSDSKSILQAYFTMITSASKRVWITTPYLVPEEGLMLALQTAALGGIDVRIIIPNKPDHFFVYWASQDNIQELLEAGVKIYTYEKGFIHSKIVLIDDKCVSIGTANLDIRSLEINFEVNAFVYDRDFNKRVEQDFIQDLSDSKIIDLQEHKNRKWTNRVLEAIGRLASPLQ